jgi:hypothetical protein
MAHYAKVESGVVTQIIKADQEFIDQLPDRESWIQTSYNTENNKHYSTNFEIRTFKTVIYDDDGSTAVLPIDQEINTATTYVLNTSTISGYFADDSPALRGNYAQVGSIYDKEHDVFYSPQPFPSWVISSATNWQWEPPVRSILPRYSSVWHEPTVSWLHPITHYDENTPDFITWVETSIANPTAMISFLPNEAWTNYRVLVPIMAHAPHAGTSTVAQQVLSALKTSTYTEVVSYITEILSTTTYYDVALERFNLSVYGTATVSVNSISPN